ncbi:MAG: peptide ABC transporter substrate-binding protein [Pyrinomonadaceae bacterium]
MFGPPTQFRSYAPVRNRKMALLICFCAFFAFSCEPSKTRNSDAFYASPVPPRKQEFRWSNGKAPKSLDPALASAPPETDIVRAIYEGLTDLDPKTLREVPGVAETWDVSTDNRTWTFHLRKDAKWTNGNPVTAGDFVRSWKRLTVLGDKTANRNLLDNIAGMRAKKEIPSASPTPTEVVREPPTSQAPISRFLTPKRTQVKEHETTADVSQNGEHPENGDRTVNHKNGNEQEKFGVEAVSDTELKVTLIAPDKDFPKVVANPIFRPIYGDGKDLDQDGLDPDTVTNGAFRILSIDQGGVVASRSDRYWNKADVALESVRFVPVESADKALDAYRSGDVDAVTNADLEPLALKLLSPYSDFRQVTHNAVNLYEINSTRAPFTDRRVREALAIGIERNQITESEMKGSTEPAFHFLPYDASPNNKLSQDADRARMLLMSAGFPGGDGFPAIRLVVNRNDTQLRIARSVVRMWKQNLNLNVDIVVKETSEMEATRISGDYDIIRRGVVFPSTDKAASFAALFPNERQTETNALKHGASDKQVPMPKAGSDAGGPSDSSVDNNLPPDANSTANETAGNIADDTALFDFRLIPLYFPVSYGLVKPYVQGFELNGLDSPSLKDVKIDSDWQPKSSN